jgi:hypothetical protein
MDTEELVSRSMSPDSNLAVVGAVLVETLTSSFWTDKLTVSPFVLAMENNAHLPQFYQMALVMVNTILTNGSFPQAGMAFMHLAMIAISRFNMIKFASDMGHVSIALIDRWRDHYTMGRGGSAYYLFVGHIQMPIPDAIPQLEGTLEYAIQAGDRISTIFNFGLVGNLRFFASEHLADLEAFCTYGCEEIQNWQDDTRGGTMIISVRQVAKALQGKVSLT